MFKTFEVRPIVISGSDEITPFITFEEAQSYNEENDDGGSVSFGLYALETDGRWMHISDRANKASMLELVRDLLGVNLEWSNSDRLEFDRRETDMATVVVNMNGSAIYTASSDRPVRLILLDEDVEGSDGERVTEVNDETVYVHDYLITEKGQDGMNCIAPEFIAGVVEQINAEPTLWTNHYLCPCGERWEDQWSAQCNDRCPSCNKEIEPFISDDGSVTEDEIEAAYEKAKGKIAA